VSRLLAAIIEQHHDERGCIWTRESAPFAVEIIVSNVKKEEEKAAGEKLYRQLSEAGVEVLLDDRPERFGPKMSDFELIGIPLGIVVGKKLAEGKVELIVRDGLERIDLPLDDAAAEILKRV